MSFALLKSPVAEWDTHEIAGFWAHSSMLSGQCGWNMASLFGCHLVHTLISLGSLPEQVLTQWPSLTGNGQGSAPTTAKARTSQAGSAAKGKASACLWEKVSQILYLLEISYSWASTAQGIPATVTVSAMSWCFCPRFEPVMVILVPPSTGPDRGYTCKDIHARVNVTVSQTSTVWWLIYSTGPFSCPGANSACSGHCCWLLLLAWTSPRLQSHQKKGHKEHHSWSLLSRTSLMPAVPTQRW